MQELEKILEEIEDEENRMLSDLQLEVSQRLVNEMRKYVQGLRYAKVIIRNHMNGGWIPVEEQLPEVDEGVEETIEDDECPEYIVTIRGAQESTTLKYSPDGTWFDENGYVYDVIAWQPLPELYRPEGSNLCVKTEN